MDTVPFRHMALIAHYARTQGLAKGRVAELLEKLEAEPDDLEGRASDALYSELLMAIHEASRDPRLWFDVGRLLTPNALGHVGQLLMTSATLGDALRTLERFYPLLQSATELVFEEDADGGHLLVSTRYPRGSTEARVRLEAVASAARQSVHVLTAASPPIALSFAFDYPAPDHAGVYADCLGGPVRFDQPRSCWSVPHDALRRPLPFRDPSAHAVLRPSCERYLQAFLNRQPARPIEEEVARRIRYSDRLALTLEDAALQLAMSPRTLSRRLSASGSGFETIRTRERRAVATSLLLDSELSIAEIASRVGFDDASNFSRAFGRWQGTTPSSFRKRARRDGPRARFAEPGATWPQRQEKTRFTS